jgi:hypothetical protein
MTSQDRAAYGAGNTAGYEAGRGMDDTRLQVERYELWNQRIKINGMAHAAGYGDSKVPYYNGYGEGIETATRERGLMD